MTFQEAEEIKNKLGGYYSSKKHKERIKIYITPFDEEDFSNYLDAFANRDSDFTDEHGKFFSSNSKFMLYGLFEINNYVFHERLESKLDTLLDQL